MTAERVLDLQGVVAGHDGTAVVHDVDLEVHASEVVALLGPNGAGKTTTLRTVSGLLPLLGGQLRVLGETVPRGAAHRVARRGVGHVTESRSLFFALTVAENLRLAARSAPGRRSTAIDEVLGLFPELVAQLGRRAGLLSGGQQQMLAMARAMVGRPRLLLIDEMSLGLAPIVVQRILPIVRAAATDRGAGVLLVEQHVGMALSVADRAYVMAGGRIALSGSAAELSEDGRAVQSTYLGDRSPTTSEDPGPGDRRARS